MMTANSRAESESTGPVLGSVSPGARRPLPGLVHRGNPISSGDSRLPMCTIAGDTPAFISIPEDFACPSQPGCRLLMPLAVLIGCVLLGGCGDEKIPLKKVDFVLDEPPKDYKETRKEFSRVGPSSRLKKDPSGINK